jgi:DNA-nicking Smr family endonuclease
VQELISLTSLGYVVKEQSAPECPQIACLTALKRSSVQTMATKPPKTYATYRPFENLKELLAKRSFDLPSGQKDGATEQRANDFEHGADSDENLFQTAMADVEPIMREPASSDGGGVSVARVVEQDPEDEALSRLKDLVRGGEGFIISDTAEYIEGIGYGVNPDVARRLHQGDFSIQAHLDLHGLVAADAKEAFEQFLKEASLSGKKAVLVVHGRGLSSPTEPVLKAKVKEWLTTGPWRKWVIAFTSARACDGGTGATYILLRQRPATKRLRRKHHKNTLS